MAGLSMGYQVNKVVFPSVNFPWLKKKRLHLGHLEDVKSQYNRIDLQ